MNGRGSRSQDKWGSIGNVLKRRKIAVLALQETHPDGDLRETVEKHFRNSLHVVHSADPDEPGARGGVSVVINKSIIDVKKIDCKQVIEGRAMLVEVPWNGDDTLRIMNIYAPADNAEKAKFWEELLRKVEESEDLRPDVVMGDFNLVENPEVDRLHNRGGADPMTARNAMSELTTELNLTDGWRRRNPTKRGYTYAGRSQSRLDRIHVKEDLYPWCTDWRIEHPGVKTDHSLVSVQLTSENMPYIGRGRWAIPVNLLKNKQLKKETQRLAREMQDEVISAGAAGSVGGSPQVALKTFKTKVVELYRNHQKTSQPRLENAIKNLQKEMQDKPNAVDLTEDEIHEQTGMIAERIEALEKKRRDEARMLGSARNRLEGETMSKHWVRSAKESTPRDTIRALRNPLQDPERRETRSDKMAEIARKYHEQLLTVDRDPAAEPDGVKMDAVLGNIRTSLAQGDIDEMKKNISEDEVVTALTSSANDKAAGLDGIPMELWKLLLQQYKSTEEKERHKYCDIASVMAEVFREVAEKGITEGTRFNEGWMCPIYKKKEADNIANYRPITVLNTDYKVFTKAIATRLTKVAPSLIHPDQAGFIRGRSIFDQIEQATTTINYARLKGINGAIVALDQEKAYDKITHPYLWRILEKFAFPVEMINTIKSLYGDAPTSVMVNGVISDPFIVARGVRQGDPMSCILFDLSIEPLAANIRASGIRGIEVPNLDEKIKVSLFADDTTVILTEYDSFAELTDTLDRWCEVSGAKFNVEKTEIIPIGAAEYRKELLETRRIGGGDEKIPDAIHIAGEGDATRLLGAWVGNGVNPEEPWRVIVETIRKDLRRWEARYPTLEGKRHVLQMVVGGKTQFLTRAQGMPESVQKEIQKAVTEFIWGKERAVICIENMARDVAQGGRKMVDIAKRNMSIDLMWIKQYLNMGPNRPKWAYMVDEIFRMERPKSAKETHQMIERWNPLTQDWKPKSRSTNIPRRVQNALRLARKCGVELEVREPSEETKREMPVWLHRKASRDAARIYKTEAAKCLKNNHCKHYMGQLLELTEGVPGEHWETNFCTCSSCREMSEKGCVHPDRCLKTAKKLIEAIAPEWRPAGRHETGKVAPNAGALAGGDQHDGVLVDMAWEETDLRSSIRIFTERESLMEVTNLRGVGDEPQVEEELVVYTDGSCVGNGTAEARAGCGVWYGANDPRNMAIRVPGEKQSNQVGELLAILHAIKSTPGAQPLKICSDSRFAIDGLTKHAPGWEKKDWMQVKHGALFKCATAWLRARTGKTTLKWVKGHAGVEGNEGADRLAAVGVEMDPGRGEIDLRIPENTVATGAELPRVTQSMIYRHMVDQGCIQRVRTRTSLEKIKTAVRESFNETPTEEAIWKSMRHKDITRKVRDFLWKHAQGVYRLGAFWSHIPGYEDRAECPLCHTEDTLEHIVAECESTEKKVVWSLTNRLWNRRYDGDLPRAEGAVLGGGLAMYRTNEGRPDAAKNRLYRVLVTEAAHLIWVLRCERRIKGGDDPGNYHTEAAMSRRWHRRMNERMQIDCLLTNAFLYEGRALKTRTVYNTWEKCSTNTEDLHREWCRHPGVLVGRPPRQDG